MIQEFAPAKLNLYLHVTGRQANGFHDLDSLAVFAGVGDSVVVEDARELALAIEGPMAAKLTGESVESNLVHKAARALAETLGRAPNVAITLTKNLPVASGIGGGSSDGAAALRALARQWGLRPDDPILSEIAAKLGQDVLVCLAAQPCKMTATGVAEVPSGLIPHTDIVLVNPNKGLPTPDVFRNFREQGDTFSPFASALPERISDAQDLARAMATLGNDLEKPALRLMPETGEVLASIAGTENCLLSRMSGSGATCFGLYPDRASARLAASHLLAAHRGWWVVPSYLPARAVGLSEGMSTDTT